MSDAHSRLEELLPIHVLGALDGAERAEMEAHVATCADCRQRWVAWEEVLEDVAAGVPPVTISPSLRERVLAATERPLSAGAVATTPAAPDTAAESQPLSPRAEAVTPLPAPVPMPRRTPAWVPWAALAASLLALVVSWAGWMMRDVPGLTGDPQVASVPERPGAEDDRRAESPSGELDQARAEIEILRQRLDRLSLAVQALGSPRGQTYALASDGLDQAPAAAVGATFVDARLARGTFHVFGLPQVPEDKTYQLWRITGGTPESAGTFQVAADGSGSLALDGIEPAEGDVWAVTVEQAGGVAQPTLDAMVLKSG